MQFYYYYYLFIFWLIFDFRVICDQKSLKKVMCNKRLRTTVLGGHMIEDLRHEDYLLLNALAQMYVESDKWVSIFWIGGNDIDEEGKWKWTHSGLFSKFSEAVIHTGAKV